MKKSTNASSSEPTPGTDSDQNTLVPAWKDIHVESNRKGVFVLRGEHHPHVGVVITVLSAQGKNPVTATELFIPAEAAVALLEYLEDVSLLEDLAEEYAVAK